MVEPLICNHYSTEGTMYTSLFSLAKHADQFLIEWH